ncbi:MAG: hypothetical protein K5669_00045 [Lachnospiraceae bacterium]|nr:hypothetical protein [Lachnospiraceae bacterium]
MEHSEEVEVVKKALELEKGIDKATKEYNSLIQEQYPELPPAPIKREVTKAKYPAIKSNVKFNYLLCIIPAGTALLLCFIFFVLSIYSGLGLKGLFIFGFLGFLFLGVCVAWTLIYIFKIWKPKRDDDIENIKRSPLYKSQCEVIDSRYVEECNAVDAEYKNALDEYNNKTVAEYSLNKQKWQDQRDLRLHKIEDLVGRAKIALSNHYEKTKLIPEKYHRIDVLEYVYSVISTSEYTLKEAIQDYERETQRQIDIAQVQAQQDANDILDRQNQIAEKARRDQLIGNIVGTVQRHNTNKTLNNIFKKM